MKRLLLICLMFCSLMVQAQDLKSLFVAMPDSLSPLWTEVGEQIGLSRVQLYRKTKALCGYSPNELLRIARLKKAASLLASTEKTISEITYEVGFSSPSYFTKCYKEYFGENPTAVLKRKK